MRFRLVPTKKFCNFLADRICAVWSTVGAILSSVCPSFCDEV